VLSPTIFRVLVDSLGMSYGLSGKLAKAKETFEYGIVQDPQYPLFYYNLACTYGEMGKKDESLEQLRLAYKYKANIIAGESFPDPLKDDSFRRFLSDPGFVQAVREMQRP
jgi:tetratricopeptide (TPR) repeat protein